MQIRYIADLHLYDPYSYAWRSELDLNVDGFASMLIDKWNTVVSSDDITIIVGDVGKLCPATVYCIRQLKGAIVLVVGNHDTSWGKNLYRTDIFQGTHYAVQRDSVYIQHIPDMKVFRDTGATYFIHGHHHRYDLPGMQLELRKYAKDVYRLNCSADLIGYTPRTLQELILEKELLLDRCRKNGLLGGN